MEWIPRSQKNQADFLSRIDRCLSPLSFYRIDLVWGPHTVDRFANHVNAKLPRFNSRFWNPGSEGIDAFVMNWDGENNYACPPICLILRLLLHMRNEAYWPIVALRLLLADDLSRWKMFCQFYC